MAKPSKVLDEAVEDPGAWVSQPYLAYDRGEVSGPYGNWTYERLTVRRLAEQVQYLTKKQRLAFLLEIGRQGFLDPEALQRELEQEALRDLRESVK